jgi:branched-chain amino acid transport system permease protein
MFNQFSGVIRPPGEIVFSANASTACPREIARLGMSRTFQHVRLLPNMSVLENVAIGAHARQGRAAAFDAAWSARRSRAARRSRRQIERVGLGDACTPRQPAAGPAAHRRDRPRPVPRPLLLLLDEPPPACATAKSRPWPTC